MKLIGVKVFTDSFPRELSDNCKRLYKIFRWKKLSSSPFYEAINLHSESIKMPIRLYFYDLSERKLKNLSDIEFRMICCYYLKHHNGYSREKFLQYLLERKIKYYWEYPYLFSLIGEYVIEIIQIIYSNWESIDNEMLKEFVLLNPQYIKKIEAKIMSYWNVYYRSQIPKKEYVGFKIINKLSIIIANQES